MTDDLIARYLADLKASLRTPPERTAEIVAEAEDHLRSAAAAGENLGLTERDAQQAAITAFGPVRDVVRAHRRPASAVLAEAGTAAMRLAGVYLLAISCIGLALLVARTLLVHALPPHAAVIVAPPDNAPTVAALAACAISGLTLLAERRIVARWRGDVMPAGSLGGYFPLVAALSVLAAAPFMIVAVRALRPPGDGFQWALGMQVTVLYATIALVAGYTVQMLGFLVRPRAGADEGRVPDAG